jgi:hypothetical protein
MPGPIPKRSDQRRRRNAPEPGQEIRTHTVAGDVKSPPASQEWHPIARRWYLSLRASGQAKFYEPSDWAAAMLTAEVLSRALSEEKIPASTLAIVSNMMTELLTTEGARRRARLEIEREATKPKLATVTPANDFRNRLGVAT